MKLPFDLNLKLVFRLLLPGFILASAFYPILAAVLASLKVSSQLLIAYIVSALLFGWLVVVMDMHIYMLYEGRRYWPAFLWNGLLGMEKARLERTWKAATEGATDRIQAEASVELRWFPIKEETGNFDAEFPTRLGNLLTAFEGYSGRVYGMDSIFYWPRLWLTLDKDLREEIDSLQAMADSTTYASLSFYVSGVLGLGYAAVTTLEPALLPVLPARGMLVGLASLAFLLGYFTYRISLPLHAQFGEIFKSVFDLYREKVLFSEALSEVGRLTGVKHMDQLPKKDQYKKVWRYLHNYRVKFKEGVNEVAYTPNDAEKMLAARSDGAANHRDSDITAWLARLIQAWKSLV
jgi:hypothetical protein